MYQTAERIREKNEAFALEMYARLTAEQKKDILKMMNEFIDIQIAEAEELYGPEE